MPEAFDPITITWKDFVARVAQMTTADEINRHWLTLLHEEAMDRRRQQQRIAVLRARWRALFGDAMFVVDDE